MKELLAFTFALFFIACQNQPFSNFSTPPAITQSVATTRTVENLESSACVTETADPSLDIVKELQDSEQPGIHYRETPKMSEFDFENGYETLACTSSVTSSDDLQEQGPAAETEQLAAAPSAPVETGSETAPGWSTLTEKWEYRPTVTTCLDPQADSNGPACKEVSFEIEAGKLFSSYSVDTSVQSL